MKERLTERIRSLRVSLWTLIVPPSVWAAHFLFSYLWAALNCAKVGQFARFPTLFAVGTVLALLVILAAGAIAYVQQATPGDEPPHESGTRVDRLRFIAKSTLLLAGLSFVGVIFTATPVVFLTDCR
ncbi:hypothetical protein GCM10011380_11090 [Sphingomonas metalli]|uniref:Transmembrane protein n=1 Tax=Sphingomonas metalli TaxID=1779358 RepID=A0A916SZE6_9SPHN|nr:hypothetical protein [Sphingomonas metalli]GGB23173.1 hypothetical protein GCM10011380_11090 [Sphingomonas metalli]